MPRTPRDLARAGSPGALTVAASFMVAVAAAVALLLSPSPAQADVERAGDSSLRLGELFDPLGRVAGGGVDVMATTTASMVAVATPPPPPPAPVAACPAPDARFIDSWGFARSGGRRHKGVDMMAPYGSPVLAPVAGTIRASNSALGGLGFYLDDAEGNSYFGSHLATLTVREGWVEAGTPIGTVGTTGNASTPHLHFEVMLAGAGSVNPFPFAVDWCGEGAVGE
jgi:murein DD-endopeptidase MepM/ murein hydrolase activator NlpD